jgi:hypothetical protein
MSSLSPRQVAKKTPRVRAAFKKAKAKQKAEGGDLSTKEERKRQETAFGIKRGK